MNDIESPLYQPGRPHGASEPPPFAGPSAPASQRASLRDALTLLFYHARLIRNCMLLGLIAGIAGAVLSKPSFNANALVLVLIGPDAMSAQDAAGINPQTISIDGLKVVQSEMQIMQSERVLLSAVRQVGPGVIYPALAHSRFFGLRPPLSPERQIGEAVQRLRGDLRVEAEPGSNVVRISFSNSQRPVAIRVVQAVVDAYLTQRQTAYAGGSARFLTREIERYHALLQHLDEEIEDVRRKYNVLDLAQDEVLAIDRLDGVVQRQNQVRERRVAVETEIVAVKANLAKQPETVLDFRETTNNTGNDEARNTLVRLEQERTYLTSQFKPDWPQIAEVDKKIATARSEMGSKAGNLYFSERRIRNPAIDLLQNRLASLEVENQALNKQLVELADQNKAAGERVASLRQAEGQLHSLQLSRDVSEGIYRQLAQKQPAALLQDQLSSDPNASLRVVQPATAPVIGRSLAISYVLGGFFLGLLVGAAAATVATLLRQVYIAPAEAERELRVPTLATIDSPVSADNLEHHAAIVRLGALLREATIDGRPLSSLQLMGLSRGDDRAALVRALATELSSGFECDTLILDLESQGAPFAAELGSEAAPAMAGLPVQVSATRIPRLWLAVASEQSPLNDWHSSIARARGALEALRQRFGMVLLLAPAELAGHAVHRLAVMVDANILILRAEHTRGPVALRLRDAVMTAGGNVLGFMFVGRKYYVPRWLLRWV